jgi:hypothetical protein
MSRSTRRGQIAVILAVTAAMTMSAACSPSGDGAKDVLFVPTSAPASPPAASALLPAAPAGSPASAALLAAGHWTTLPVAPIPARSNALGIWTGSQVIVWGGASGAQGDQLRSDGAAYTPSTRTWKVLSPAPISGRTGMVSVWTGQELFIWGGNDSTAQDSPFASDGAVYRPSDQQWRKLPPSPLTASQYPQAALVNGIVIVVGISVPPPPTTFQPGAVKASNVSAAAYDPNTNVWTLIPAMPSTDGHHVTYVTVAANERRLFVWQHWESGDGSFGIDRVSFDPATRAWQRDSAATNPPRDVPGHAGIDEAIPAGPNFLVPAAPLWCGGCPGPPPDLAPHGWLYSIAGNTWTTIPEEPAGSHWVWTGAALLSVFGSGSGDGTQGVTPRGASAAWDPATNRWSRLPDPPFDAQLGDAVAVWAGDQLIEWGSMYPPAEPVTGAGTVTTKDVGVSLSG